jgi:hypothetical protein
VLACDHDRPPFGAPICAHLRTCRQPWLSYVKWYVGSGLEVELLCVQCADERGKGVPVHVASALEGSRELTCGVDGT